MGRSFGRGAAFLSMGAIASRFTGVFSQVVLGAILTKEQFGVFGVALGVMTVTGSLRGGVVHQYLQTLSPERFEKEAGAYVRLAAYACALGAMATLIAAIVVPYWRPEPGLRVVLFVMAAHALMPFFNSPLRARMQVAMRFGTMATVDTINTALRTVIAILLALFGAGPAALAIPLLAGAMFEAVVFSSILRLPIFSMAARGAGGTRDAFRTVRWTLLLAIASTSVFQGDYLAGSLFASSTVVGVYYFAYGLCNQSGALAASMLGEVVGPVIAQLRHDPQRRAAAALRIARGIGILLPGLVFAIPVIFPELDHLIWKGGWQDAATTSFLLSAQVTLLLTTTLLYATRHGQGDFRSPAIFECMRGAAVLIGAGLGAWLSPTPEGIALGALGIGGTTSLAVGAWIIRSMGVSAATAVRVMLGGPLAGFALAVGLRYGLDQIQGWSGADDEHRWRWGIEVIVEGIAYVALYLLAVRVFFHRALKDMLSVAPARISKPLRFLA
ncbi:MAG: oligosaccharide flippase family protein [Phycisphaerae bacterium]|nr:oligosaccharide flippase family protein [Phycisphaerae bacterium]